MLTSSFFNLIVKTPMTCTQIFCPKHLGGRMLWRDRSSSPCHMRHSCLLPALPSCSNQPTKRRRPLACCPAPRKDVLHYSCHRCMSERSTQESQRGNKLRGRNSRIPRLAIMSTDKNSTYLLDLLCIVIDSSTKATCSGSTYCDHPLRGPVY